LVKIFSFRLMQRIALLCASRLDLKGEFVGQTAPKVQAMFKAAMGGCLFLDEAYALADGEGGSDVFAKEAVRTLLTEVENNRTGLLVVLAGYKDKMAKLMRADPGLPRRWGSTPVQQSANTV
jgi:hypothetical protein